MWYYIWLDIMGGLISCPVLIGGALGLNGATCEQGKPHYKLVFPMPQSFSQRPC